MRIDIRRDQWLITKNECSRLYIEDPENYEYLSSFECVGSRRDILSNMLIFSGKEHLEKWVKKNDLDDDMTLAVSNSGYSNNEISFEWYKHFDQYIQKK